MAHLIDLAGLDQLQRVQDFRRRYQIGGADLIILAPFGRPPRRDSSRAGRRRLSLGGPASRLGGGRRQAEERAGETARRQSHQRTAIVVDAFSRFRGGVDEIGIVIMIAHFATSPKFAAIVCEARNSNFSSWAQRD
jgi:hypothetical protein